MKYRLPIPDTPGGWGTICLDPPWRLNTGGIKRKLQYDSMHLGEIKLMGKRIREVAHPDGHLWLWIPSPHLPDGFEVLRAFGYSYKACLAWRKTRQSGKRFMGLGWWLRSEVEFLLFGVKTNKLRVQPSTWTNYLAAPWRGHSVKPDEAYELIQALSPEPRLELFARGPRAGWTCLISDQPPTGDPYGPGSD